MSVCPLPLQQVDAFLRTRHACTPVCVEEQKTYVERFRANLPEHTMATVTRESLNGGAALNPAKAEDKHPGRATRPDLRTHISSHRQRSERGQRSIARFDRARDERERRIAVAAYLRAERRRFVPGAELDDWLEAEREEDSGSSA